MTFRRWPNDERTRAVMGKFANIDLNELEEKLPLGIQFPNSWSEPETPGYGTFPGPFDYDVEYDGGSSPVSERYYAAVATAIRCGYRHIDTAQTYDNEEYVGKAIRDSEVPRNEIFLTSKLDPDLNSYEGARNGIKKSLEELETEYLDLFLLHYPGEGADPIGAWRGLLDVRSEGLCQHVGVSHFEMKHLERFREQTGEYPEVNQIEFHPLLYSEKLEDLVHFCKQNRILVEGFSPFAEGDPKILRNTVIERIAQNHNCSPARVILKWCMQHGVRPIVGSSDPTHLSENTEPYNFQLSRDEMTTIDALEPRVSLLWGWNAPEVTL